MLLRNPISTTKRFFQKTMESFKSFLSGGGGEGSYQRLPKTPPLSPFSCARDTHDMAIQGTYYGPETSYKEVRSQEAPQRKKKPEQDQKKMVPEYAAPAKKMNSGPLKAVQKKRASDNERERGGMEERRDVRICLVAERLKEMEMVDNSNVAHLLDIEEFFYCYCRLTCPAYLDIVDKFFMDLHAEFVAAQQLTQVGNSRAKLPLMRF